MNIAQQQQFLSKARSAALIFMTWVFSVVAPTFLFQPKISTDFWIAALLLVAWIAWSFPSDFRLWNHGIRWPLAARLVIPVVLLLFSTFFTWFFG